MSTTIKILEELRGKVAWPSEELAIDEAIKALKKCAPVQDVHHLTLNDIELDIAWYSVNLLLKKWEISGVSENNITPVRNLQKKFNRRQP